MLSSTFSWNYSSSSAPTLFLLLAGLSSIAYLLLSIRRRIKAKNGYELPPGPPEIPVLGHLHMLGELPHHSLQKLSKKYGPLMSLRLGLVQAVVISSPEMAELFLKTHDTIFASRPKLQVAENMYGQRGLAITQYGQYWRNVRKICNMHLLSTAKIESFKSMRMEEVRAAVRSIKDLPRETAGDGSGVDVSKKVGCLVEDVTWRMVFGAKDDSLNFKPVIQESVKLVGSFNLADFVPYIGALDLQGWTRRTKAVKKVVDECFEKIIEDHYTQNAKLKQRDDHHHQMDFIDIMLSLMDTEDGQDLHLGRLNIKAILFDMLVGAMDTSPAIIEWALSELLRHSRVMKLVQEELESVVGLDRMVEESDLLKLEYLEMVVKEVMRLHPVAPLLVPRESMEDIKINGYDIPKKTRLIVNVWAVGRDPKVWSANAEEFYPERFVGVDIDLKGQDFRLLPFGSGRRGCPGIQLGLTTVKFILAQLVHCFDWELPNGISPQDLDMTEKFGLAVPRAKHLYAVPMYRLNIENL